MIPVRPRPQHRGKPRAHRMQHGLALLARHAAVGQRQRLAVGEFQGADVDRIGAAVFGHFGARYAVAAAAFERIEVVELGKRRAEVLGERRHVGANPVRERRRHGAAEDRRRFHGDLPPVREHHGLEPDQIVAAAAPRSVNGGNARRNRNRFGQRQPASRGRRRGGLGLFRGRLVGLAGPVFNGLVVDAGRLGGTRFGQRYRC